MTLCAMSCRRPSVHCNHLSSGFMAAAILDFLVGGVYIF